MAFSRIFCGFFSFALLICPFILVRAESFEQVTFSDPARLDTEAANIAVGPLPFYTVAHRVLTLPGVEAAVGHGANALELDMTAWKNPHGGWWGDHDGTIKDRGDEALKLFEAIAEQRKAGKNITFVWLDIKNSNECHLDNPALHYCSIAALQSMAREVLQPVGVRVIYEFSWADAPSPDHPAYCFIVDNLNSYEAVTMYNDFKHTQDNFDKNGPSAKRQRVMSYGGVDISRNFGGCGDDKHTCGELRHGVESGKFGKVMAWTSTKGQAVFVDKLLGTANIDALLYGSSPRDYDDGEDIRAAFDDISNWVSKHPDRRFLAGHDDFPW